MPPRSPLRSLPLRPALAVPLLVTSLVASLVTAAPPAAATARGAVLTEESGCHEFLPDGRIPLARARAMVPDRYTVLESPAAPGMAELAVGDYTCERLSVNGSPPRPAVVTVAGVLISARDGAPDPGMYMIWCGTDHRELATAYTRLGMPCRHLPHATRTVLPLEGGGHRFTLTYRGHRLDHTLTADVPDLSREPVLTELTPNGYVLGHRGELRLSYLMTYRQASGVPTRLTVPPGSRLARHGFPPSSARSGLVYAGNWRGRLEPAGP